MSTSTSSENGSSSSYFTESSYFTDTDDHLSSAAATNFIPVIPAVTATLDGVNVPAHPLSSLAELGLAPAPSTLPISQAYSPAQLASLTYGWTNSLWDTGYHPSFSKIPDFMDFLTEWAGIASQPTSKFLFPAASTPSINPDAILNCPRPKTVKFAEVKGDEYDMQGVGWKKWKTTREKARDMRTYTLRKLATARKNMQNLDVSIRFPFSIILHYSGEEAFWGGFLLPFALLPNVSYAY
jgi:hypothetical protein